MSPHCLSPMKSRTWLLMIPCTALALAVASCRTGDHSQLQSPMDPHFKAKGPWFEGWYTHVIDETQQRDYAVVVGSFVRQGADFAGSPREGYAALVTHDQKTGATATYEAFPATTTLTVAGGPILRDPSDGTAADFKWEAAGLGAMTQDHADLTFPGGVAFHATFGPPAPINPALPWVGPEGAAAHLPFIWSHWFIYSIASKVDYSVQTAGASTTGQGVAHLEKNYGSSFPTAWMWIHALQDGGKSRLSLAGGPAPVDVLHPEVWTVAFATTSLNWLFLPGIKDLTVQRVMDPCAGTMQMTLWNPQRRIKVQGSTDPTTFVPIASPSLDGWVRAGVHESYNAHFQVDAYDLDLFGHETLRQHVVFDHGVLEFGGTFRCPAKSH